MKYIKYALVITLCVLSFYASSHPIPIHSRQIDAALDNTRINSPRIRPKQIRKAAVKSSTTVKSARGGLSFFIQ